MKNATFPLRTLKISKAAAKRNNDCDNTKPYQKIENLIEIWKWKIRVVYLGS